MGNPIMSECIFCAIIRGKRPSTKVLETEDVVAFMANKPITKGHVLVIPKKHAELLTELEDNLTGKMLVAAKRVGLALKKSKLNCRGINYVLADGMEAGQAIYHVHLHVIPRYRGDGFGLRMPESDEEETEEKDLDRIATKIRKTLEG
jgi:diadenosine tetraphosphate (Ap4A) HIT family hydrolase